MHLISDIPTRVFLLLLATTVLIGGYTVYSAGGFDPLLYTASFLVGLVTLLTGCFILLGRRRKQLKQEISELIGGLTDQSPSNLKAIEQLFLLQEFHIRAGTRNLTFALMLLLGSIGVVAFAGYFIDFDAPKVESVDSIDRALTRSIRDGRDLQRELESAIATLRDTIGHTGLTTGERNEALLNIMRTPELQVIQQRMDTNNASIRALQENYVDALKILQQADSQRVSSTNRAVGLLLFRISVLAVAIFTVILLVRAYRTNIMMGNIFRGRMMALLAYDRDVESLSLRAAAFSAEHVDFGREPKHPIDYMLRATKEFGKLFQPAGRASNRAKAQKSRPQTAAGDEASRHADPKPASSATANAA